MYSKVNYTIVGIFVLLFGAGMVWFAFWLSKYGLQEDFDTYRLEMKESIAGLSSDAKVKLNGVNIGRVSKIQINPKDIEMVEILVEIQKGIPIKEDMIASTKMFGVTGLLSIEIEGGTNAAKTLVPTKKYIPLIQTKPSLLSTLTYNLGGMSDKIENLLLQSQKLLSDQNIETMGKILENTEKVTARATEMEDKVMVSLEEVNMTLKEFRDSMAKVTTDISDIKEVTVPTIDTLKETSKNFSRIALKIEKSIDKGDYNFKKIFEPILIDIDILLDQLNTMSRNLENNPSDLLFKSRESRRGPGE
jgi:phospholipid/cholesterol/gamma-HCH transport system substrate-binding protein